MKYKQWYYRKIQLAYVTSTAVHLAWSESCAQILWPMPSWAATRQDRFRAWSFQRCCTGGLERSSTAPAGKWNSCDVQDGIEDLALSGGLRSGEMTKLRPVLSHRRASDSPCDSCARYKFDWFIDWLIVSCQPTTNSMRTTPLRAQIVHSDYMQAWLYRFSVFLAGKLLATYSHVDLRITTCLGV